MNPLMQAVRASGLLLLALWASSLQAQLAAVKKPQQVSPTVPQQVAPANPQQDTTVQPESAAKPKQFLYVLRVAPDYYDAKSWTAADNDAVDRHFERLKLAAETGEVVLAGRTSEPLDRTFGLVI